MKPSKTGMTIGLIVVIVLAVVGFKSLRVPNDSAVGDMARIKGSLKSELLIREFTDFQCPACSRVVSPVNDLIKKYEGRLALEHKHFPLKMHKNALHAALAAQCAAFEGKFWPMHDVIFRTQTSWSSMDSPEAYFLDLAAGLGLERNKMGECLKSPQTAGRVQADYLEGETIGIRSTPSFVVGDTIVVGVENLRLELEKHLGP